MQENLLRPILERGGRRRELRRVDRRRSGSAKRAARCRRSTAALQRYLPDSYRAPEYQKVMASVTGSYSNVVR